MTIPTWRVVGASVTGQSHLDAGRECEDRHGSEVHTDGTLIIAAADGAGSARLAGDGATKAVDKAIYYSKSALSQPSYFKITHKEGWERIARYTFLGVHDHLVSLLPHRVGQAEVSEKGTRPYSTTLLLVCINADYLLAAQVGDGAIVAERSDGEIDWLTWPTHGRHINESVFITGDDWEQHFQAVVLPADSVTALAIFTDGIERLGLEYATKTAFPPFFQALFAFAKSNDAKQEAVENFLLSDRVTEKETDDKTLVLVART